MSSVCSRQVEMLDLMRRRYLRREIAQIWVRPHAIGGSYMKTHELTHFLRITQLCFAARFGSANPNGLDVHELADAKLREFAAVTGMLDAAKRQPRIGRHHAVDENRSRFELFDELRLFVGIVGPCGGAETERRRICDSNRFVDV